MTDERERQAYDRIEVALARIEAAATSNVGRAPDDGLQGRHDRLRAGAEAALAAVDRLIATRAG